jgi:poly(A) polymerase/tRNA nucleotidyltransferase (CCA-adding enzyme)
MADLTPRAPAQRPLLWPDDVLDLQERLLDVRPDEPLYLVGGAVRDALLHRPIPDLDFVTPGDAVLLARRTADALDAEVFVMDAERGVARVLYDRADGRKVMDFTRFRGVDLLADLQARDFTINALCVDFRGDLSQLIDPLNGERDVLNKQVRLCSAGALADDPLRVLRAVRQSVQLGFRLLPEVVQAIRAVSSGLAQVSHERLRDEFFKVLSLDNADAALRVMQALGLMKYIVPELARLPNHEQASPYVFDAWQHTLYAVERLIAILTAISPRRTDQTAASFDLGMLIIQLDRYRRLLNQHLSEHWANERSHQALLVLAALLHRVDLATADGRQTRLSIAERVADDLRLSNAEKKRLAQIVGAFAAIHELPRYERLASHRFWFALGGAGIDALLVGMAHILAMYGAYLPQDVWLDRVELAIQLLADYFDHYEQVVNPPPLIDGNELMRLLGIAPGPQVGQLLTVLREAQVLGDVTDAESAVRYARGALGGL